MNDNKGYLILDQVSQVALRHSRPDEYGSVDSVGTEILDMLCLMIVLPSAKAKGQRVIAISEHVFYPFKNAHKPRV